MATNNTPTTKTTKTTVKNSATASKVKTSKSTTPTTDSSTTATTQQKEVRKFVSGDMIPCRCIRPNKVIYYSTKTDMRYEWAGFGDIMDVDYIDLMKWKSSKSPYLYKPIVLIEDKELREQWKRDLEPIYDEYRGFYETEDLFNMSDFEFETFVRKASKPLQEIIKISAIKGIKDGSLKSISIIRIVDDVLGTSLKDFI